MMRTSYVWRDCLIKEIDVPETHINLDSRTVFPERQDVFWVEASRFDVMQNIVTRMNDKAHKEQMSRFFDSGSMWMPLIISRNIDYFQYHPTMSVTRPGSPWKKIGPYDFSSLGFLKSLLPSP